MRVRARINIDGDTAVCVPLKKEELDESLWKIHCEMVARAQNYRAEMLKAIASTLGGLLDAFKGL